MQPHKAWKVSAQEGWYKEEEGHGPEGGDEDEFVVKNPRIAIPGSSEWSEVMAAYGRTADTASGEAERGTIDKLKDEVAGLRAKYASRMYEHSRLAANLKSSKIGRFFSLGDADEADLEYWRREYEEKLAALREAELEEIKGSRLKGQELKEAMAGLLRASKVDEVLSLISDRDTYRLEGNKWSDKVYNTFRSVGEWYNKVPKRYKIMAGVAIGSLALGTAAMGGVALAGGVKIARRLVSGAGFAVAIDAALDAKMEERFKKQAEYEIEVELDQMFGSVEPSTEGKSSSERSQEEMMQMFEERLQAASGGVTLVFEDQLFKRKLNGVAGVAAGTIAGFAGSAAMEWFKESGAADATRDILFGQDAEPIQMTDAELAARTAAARDMAEEYGSASPERQLDIRNATSMTDGQLSALARTIEIEGGHIVPGSVSAVEIVSAGPNEIVKSLLLEHELTTADAKRGLWGVLESRLPADMSGADKARTIAALENAISLKVGQMSPEERLAAGFRGNNIGEVFAGDTLHLDRVLSVDEVRTAMEGGHASGIGSAVAEHHVAGSAGIEKHAGVVAHDHGGPAVPDRGAAAAIAEPVTEAADIETMSQALRPRVDSWFDQIFRAENEMLGSGRDWVVDRERISKISIRDMMRDAALYGRGAVSGYRTGLSVEQIKNFIQFFKEVGDGVKDQDAMTEIIYATVVPGKDMTVAEYLERVAPLVKKSQHLGPFTTPV